MSFHCKLFSIYSSHTLTVPDLFIILRASKLFKPKLATFLGLASFFYDKNKTKKPTNRVATLISCEFLLSQLPTPQQSLQRHFLFSKRKRFHRE
jgi:hypothetical protein